IVTVAGEQPDALALTLDDEPVAVMLHLVNPIRTGRDLGGAGWSAGLELAGWHSGNIGFFARVWSPSGRLWLPQPFHHELDILGLDLSPALDLGVIPVLRVMPEVFPGHLSGE